MDEKLRILLCEDDENLGMLLREYLQAKGYSAELYPDGEAGYKAFLKNKYDLCVFDVMMPKKDGFTLAKEVRQINSEIPIIFLTAKSMKEDVLEGFKLGADDYMTKPFNPLELTARVKSQLRRYTQYNEGTKEEGDVLDFGGLLLNRTSHECVYNEVPLTLTPIEFDILWLLCENRGKVISSEELFEKVWHEKYYKNSNNTVMVHIRHLREKMSAPTGKSDFIKTVWGVGYKVEE